MSQFTLTQTQIRTLYEFAERFKDVPEFNIHVDDKSGIGPTYTVKFQIFGKDVEVDNTDTSSW
jgi:hypothetical protein